MPKIIDIQFLASLGRLSAPILKAAFAGGRQASKKAGGELVTETDRAVSKALCEALAAAGFKPEEIISEEEDRPAHPSVARLWLIDPLDGTKEFVAGRPEFALSIAYLENGELAGGLVLNPITGFAMLGTNRENCRITSLESTPSESGSILCSRTEWDSELSGVKSGPPLLPIGSVAYKLALVAAGRARGTVSYQPKSSWDIAAGAFLVAKAGGRISDLEGNPLDLTDPYRRLEQGILASAGSADHGELLRLLKR